MDTSIELFARGVELSARSDSKSPTFKVIGISLAAGSGCLIGISFVLKKKGLLKANVKYNEEAGEGYGYLKNAFWWAGMSLMIAGELCNFAAYAFVDAILVTPLGALAVVVTTILSAIFLKERLSFVGKVGCFNCIVGSVVIVMNAPEQSSVSTIQQMQHFVIAPGFLSYAGVIIVGCLFIALWAGPRYGKKNMLVYISICSLIGGLSVVATQGLGAAIVAQIGGTPQFNQWFLYVLLVFVITTLLTEIIYLNKALNLFNAALVTPTYYVCFTSATIITSAILFQGFSGSVTSIITVVLGFFQICAGVVLLQISKSAKDVPDAAVFKGDLDQVREIAEHEQPESEPKADALRGTAAIIRRISVTRQKMEQDEARRLHDEKVRDQLEPVRENEVVEWDGLRRRKTIIGDGSNTAPIRRKTLHPPLGMSRFPEEEYPPHAQTDPTHDRDTVNFFENMRHRAQAALVPGRSPGSRTGTGVDSPMHPVALTEINVPGSKTGGDTPIEPFGPGSLEEAEEHIYGLPQGLRRKEAVERNASSGSKDDSKLAGPPSARRQFSFQNVFRPRTADSDTNYHPAPSPSTRSKGSSQQKKASKNATEEERLGLVKGDSQTMLIEPSTAPRPPQHSHSESTSTASSTTSLSQMPAHRHYDGDSDSENDWQITSPPRSDSSPISVGQLYQPTSTRSTDAGPTTSYRRQEAPSLPRTAPFSDTSQFQQRGIAHDPPPLPPSYYSRESPGNSRSRDRSASEVEYDRSRARFESRGRSQEPGSGPGSGAFI